MQSLKKTIDHLFKYLLRITLGLLTLLLLIIGFFYYTAISQNDQVPKFIANLAKEKLNVELGFADYSFSCLDYFPSFSLDLKNVYIKGSHYTPEKQAFLQMEHLHFVFRPIDFVQNIYTAKTIELDGLKLFIHKDSLGNANTDFLKTSKSGEKINNMAGLNGELAVEMLYFNNLEFSYIDDLRGKVYEVDLPRGILKNTNEKEKSMFHLNANCHFKQLLFKKANGPFLENKEGHLNLFIETDGTFKNWNCLPSSLLVDEEEIELQGSFEQHDTNYLELHITHRGIQPAKALPLLSHKLQKDLAPFEIDEAIKTNVMIAGPLIPEHPPAIHVDFSTTEAQLLFKDIRMEKMNVIGRFENDCAVSDKVGPTTGCLYISQLSGDLMGQVPLDLTATLRDLKNLDDLDLDISFAADVPDLKPYLEEEFLIQLDEGEVEGQLTFKGNPVLLSRGHHKGLPYELNGQLKIANTVLHYPTKNIQLNNINGALNFDKNAVHFKQMEIEYKGMTAKVQGRVGQYLPNLLGEKIRLETTLDIVIDQLLIDQFQTVEDGKPAVSSSLDKEFNSLMEDLNKLSSLNAKVQVDELKGKHLKVKDLSFHLQADSCMFHDGRMNNTCLFVDQINGLYNENIPFNGRLNITDSLVDFYTNTAFSSGVLNQYFNKDTLLFTNGDIKVDVSGKIPIKNITELDTIFQNGSLRGTITLDQVTGVLPVQQLDFKQLNGALNFNQSTLIFETFSFLYDSNEVNVTGIVDNYLPVLLKEADEKIVVDIGIDIPYYKVDSQMFEETEKERFYPKEKIVRPLNQWSDYLEGRIDVSLAYLDQADYPMESVSFNATYFEEQKNNQLVDCFGLQDFKAVLLDDVTLSMDVAIIDFSDPELRVNMEGDVPFEKLSRFVPEHLMRLQNGETNFTINYEVDLDEYLNTTDYILNAGLDGVISIDNGAFFYTGRGLQFDKIATTIYFDERNLQIEQMDLLLNNNPVKAVGLCPNLFHFLFKQDEKFHINIEASSPKFSFDHFETPEELGIEPEKEVFTSGGHKLEELLNVGTMELDLAMDEAIIGAFKTQNVNGIIKMSADEVELKAFKMLVADGDFYIHGHIKDVALHQPKADVEVRFNENDIQKVFLNFENFGQEDLRAENIKGAASSQINFKANLNANYEVIPESIRGDMFLTVQNGQLLDIDALSDLTGFVFKKRKLNDIAFDTLKTVTTIEGYDLIVDRFFIHSTSFDFGVQGVYHLGREDKTSLLFEIPLGNLFKRHIDKEILMRHDTKRKGPPIVVSAVERKNKLHFKLHLLTSKKKRRRWFSKNKK